MVFIKKVDNADAGDADHLGGNDWDKLDDFFADVVDSATAKINSTFEVTASKFKIRDATDETKEIVNDVSAITTGTTRTITWPDANVDLGGLVDANLASGVFANITGLGTQTQTLEMGDKDVNNLKILTFGNQDAGADPILQANSSAQFLDLTGGLIVSANLLMNGGDIRMSGNNIDDGGVFFLKEQAEADADVAGSGQLWVDTVTPNEMFFTNDAGLDIRLDSTTWGIVTSDVVITLEENCWFNGNHLWSTATGAKQFSASTAGTMKNFNCRITTNSNTGDGAVLNNRINDADGNLTLAFLQTTGTFQDTSNSDTIANADQLNFQYVQQDSTIEVRSVGVEFLPS